VAPLPDGLTGLLWRQRSEQYLTCSQSRAHLRRQTKGSPQVTQTF